MSVFPHRTGTGGLSRVDIDLYRARVDDLFQSNEARAFVADAARKLADAAHDAAPVGATGETAESYEAYGSEIRDGVATSFFGSNNPVWHIIEFGSVNNPPYRPMLTAVERCGLRYEPR
jgi:hypothetical protein